MIQISPKSVLIAPILIGLAATVGCQESSDAAKDNASRYAKQGPEESFEMIVETFRRGVEDVPIGFVSRDGDGHSMMTGRNEVSHELIRPVKAGDPYKAIITVGSQSRYSIQRSTSQDEDQQSEEQDSGSFAQNEEDAGFKIFDRKLVNGSESRKDSRAAPSTSDNSEKSVTRQVDQQERNYELLYEDGKWRLITKLDPETEQSIQNAFDRALNMQI